MSCVVAVASARAEPDQSCEISPNHSALSDAFKTAQEIRHASVATDIAILYLVRIMFLNLMFFINIFINLYPIITMPGMLFAEL